MDNQEKPQHRALFLGESKHANVLYYSCIAILVYQVASTICSLVDGSSTQAIVNIICLYANSILIGSTVLSFVFRESGDDDKQFFRTIHTQLLSELGKKMFALNFFRYVTISSLWLLFVWSNTPLVVAILLLFQLVFYILAVVFKSIDEYGQQQIDASSEQNPVNTPGVLQFVEHNIRLFILMADYAIKIIALGCTFTLCNPTENPWFYTTIFVFAGVYMAYCGGSVIYIIVCMVKKKRYSRYVSIGQYPFAAIYALFVVIAAFKVERIEKFAVVIIVWVIIMGLKAVDFSEQWRQYGKFAKIAMLGPEQREERQNDQPREGRTVDKEQKETEVDEKSKKETEEESVDKIMFF